jgi:outer membrane receptor for ferrienterochelin and colicins
MQQPYAPIRDLRMRGATSGRFFQMGTLVLAAALAGLTASAQSSGVPKTAPADEPSPSLESLFQTKVVTASRFAENVADAPGAITVVTRDEIDRFGGLTLREILNRVSGLDLSSNIFTDRSIITVRGDQVKDTGVHVLFLINGRPTREVLEGGVMTELLESFPVGILERNEVIEGPGSVLYGSNAFSGVINLITRKAEGTGGAIRGFGTGAGPSGGSGEGWYRRGDFSLTGAVQFHENSTWNTPLVSIGSSAPSGVLFPLRDSGAAVYADIGYKGFSAMISTMEWSTPFSVLDLTGNSRWRRTFADIGYDLKPAAHWDMGFHATYTGTGFDSLEDLIVDRKAGELEIDWTNSVEVNERIRIAFGALYNYQFGRELDTAGGYVFTSTDASRPSGGGYAQLEFRVSNDLNLIGGFQVDKVSNIPAHAVPRVGAVWNPRPHWYLKTLYGQAFRAPSLNETQTLNPSIRGDWDLHPELSSTLDLGVTYQGNRLETTINYFRTRQTNTIEIITIGPNAFQYENEGGILFHGMQWESKWFLRPKWLVQGSALYQTNLASTGQALQLPTPHFGAKGGISYADRQGWTVGLFDVYSGLVPGFASTPNPKPGAYHLISANLRLNLAKYFGPGAKNIALFAHGDNLANRSIWEPAWGYGSTSTLPVERGRTIYFGVEFSFKRD